MKILISQELRHTEKSQMHKSVQQMSDDAALSSGGLLVAATLCHLFSYTVQLSVVCYPCQTRE